MEKNISIKKAADLLGKSQQFVRIGLQRGLLPFGVALQMSSKYTYSIIPGKFYKYIERPDLIEEGGEEKCH